MQHQRTNSNVVMYPSIFCLFRQYSIKTSIGALMPFCHKKIPSSKEDTPKKSAPLLTAHLAMGIIP